MDQFLWQKRPLILLTTDKSNTDYTRQNAAISKTLSAMKDRDMVLIEVIDGKTPDKKCCFLLMVKLCLIYKHVLYLNILIFVPEQEKFRLLLIGKDGGTKFVKNHFVEMKYILSIIDSMPMRQQEMKKKKN